jgi:hypothetical protein
VAIPTIATGSGAASDAGTPFRAKRAGCLSGIHSSMSRCALIPPNPNPLMAARRGTSAARRFHAWLLERMAKGLPASFIAADGRSKFAMGGKVPQFMARIVLIKPSKNTKKPS